MSRRVEARIDLAAVAHNLKQLEQRALHSRTLAVVKADAYGHGAVAVARHLRHAPAFAVAGQGEAEALRAAGVRQPILLFGGFDDPADLPRLAGQDIRPAVHHPAQLEMLEQASGLANLRVWLVVDSGMNRLGFPPGELRAALQRLRACPGVSPDIVLMSHFAASDEPGSDSVARQIGVFREATAGLNLPVSLANSTGVLDHPDSHADWNRPGGALYGLTTKPGCTGPGEGLRPAMRLATRLIAIRDKPAGAAIGYGGRFVCPRPMRIGVAAIGYADGYPRHAPTGTPVLVNGRRCQLVGRVSMDLITIDLSAVPDAAVGDEVVLWGDDLAVEEVATAAATISYELTCRLTSRVRFASS